MQVISEAPIKITKGAIDSAWRRRKPDQRLIVRDKDCRGLALIVNPTGMVWTYAYRPRGTDPRTGRRWPNKAFTLGNPATHSPDDARAEANKIKGQAAAGGDPSAEKKARAAEDRRKRGATLKRLLDDYETALPGRPKMRGHGLPSAKYVAEEVAQARQSLSIMEAEDMPAADLSDAEVRKLLRRPSDGAAIARARFGALSRFMDWCQDAGHIKTNPCVLISRARRPKAPPARSHYLSPADLMRLWEAADRLREPVWRDLARLLIVVPCRRGEAARVEWSHIDLAAAEWRQPSHMTKNQDPHRLHLHRLALDVLRERHKATGGKGLVFPAPVSGRPVDTFSDLKTELDKAAELDGWTWHDFRRSFATVLGEASIPEAVADAVLNHRQSATRGGVLGVYQRASRWPEQVRAMDLWGRLLTAAQHVDEAGATAAPQDDVSP
ncbi:MAG: integrase arm-type DNA-binding domain-containing protein [Rhodopila sp.]|nr:integrase arm-type DNA-binding domain-containing protein [Rhodopila sp.]